MEALQNAPFVRLRSYDRGLYLAADENGRDIFLAGGRASANTLWGVHVVDDADGEPAVLFKSTFGRYLFATDFPAIIGPSGAASVIQVNYGLGNRSPLPSMIWKVVRRQEAFLIKNSVGVFLRANGKFLRWRRRVTVAGDNSSRMMLWAIFPIDLENPSSLDTPSQETVLQLIVAEIGKKQSCKKNLETRMHGSSTRRAELQTEEKIARATKTKDALALKISLLHDEICKLQERKRQLEENISMTRAPRRWSW